MLKNCFFTLDYWCYMSSKNRNQIHLFIREIKLPILIEKDNF